MSADWPNESDHGEGCSWLSGGNCDCGFMDTLRALNAKRAAPPEGETATKPN